MYAMILAAGRGERMRPLTDTCPKPLLKAGDKPLIVWHLEKLARSGFKKAIINLAHLGEQIPQVLGNGQKFGIDIQYSHEPHGALETAGGIAYALPLLGSQPFLLINGDIWSDWDFSRALLFSERQGPFAHIVLTANPEHHPQGDFRLSDKKLVLPKTTETDSKNLTYTGIGIYHPSVFLKIQRGSTMKLKPVLDQLINTQQLTGEQHSGQWQDIGTPERLEQLNRAIKHYAS